MGGAQRRGPDARLRQVHLWPRGRRAATDRGRTTDRRPILSLRDFRAYFRTDGHGSPYGPDIVEQTTTLWAASVLGRGGTFGLWQVLDPTQRRLSRSVKEDCRRACHLLSHPFTSRFKRESTGGNTVVGVLPHEPAGSWPCDELLATNTSAGRVRPRSTVWSGTARGGREPGRGRAGGACRPCHVIAQNHP